MKWFIWLMLCGLVFSANQCESELESTPENEIENNEEEKVSYVIAELPEFKNTSRSENANYSDASKYVSWNKGDQICLWWDNKKVFTNYEKYDIMQGRLPKPSKSLDCHPRALTTRKIVILGKIRVDV